MTRGKRYARGVSMTNRTEYPPVQFPRHGKKTAITPQLNSQVTLQLQLQLQHPPLRHLCVKSFESPRGSGINITYKVPDGACRTLFRSQKQYVGWVELYGHGASRVQNHIFFWFVEARKPTSALTIWLNDRPGESSLQGFFTENGPCEDRASNMLYIDYPNTVGFSYDIPTNATIDLVQGNIITDYPQPVPKNRSPATVLNGTFSSTDYSGGVLASPQYQRAADVVWRVLQAFFGVFPHYNPPDGVNLFAQGHGACLGTMANIKVAAVGIVNGCLDQLSQTHSYLQMVELNTYDINLLSAEDRMAARYYLPGGCRDAISDCRSRSFGPHEYAESCTNSSRTCEQVLIPYLKTGRSKYDIAHLGLDPFPSRLYETYLNTLPVQQAIGTPVNYTRFSRFGKKAFPSDDFAAIDARKELAALLDSGIRVALMYSDRDYVCNWVGGEEAAFNIASETENQFYLAPFRHEGYAPLITNSSYVGGAVRQFGNLSFSRIYQAGHFAPASQPETLNRVFERVIQGKAISTGEMVDPTSFHREGDDMSTATFELPPPPKPTCKIRAMRETCTEQEIDDIDAGKGVIINDVWYRDESEWPAAVNTETEDGRPDVKNKQETQQSQSPFLTLTFCTWLKPRII
ncbi:serine carboxypeptidase [Podospora fimiseda]|uniref:Serine carboxypeptidase n=1 Tax=Podospora fimiseda TaxID=252190 RepID=A0AAN7BTQ2_9PEZI|nr:serine carboxypeptidase [Podospora fimiseda]